MHNYTKLLVSILTVITFISSLSACSKQQADLSALAEEPPHTTDQYKFKTSDSDITAGIRIPYTVIKSAIKKGLADFDTVPLHGSIDCSVDKEIKLGPIKKIVHIPCSSSYEGLLHIEQTGQVIVTNKNNKLLLAAPVRVYGQVGLRGKTAQELGLKNKNVDAAITVKITLDFGLKTDWNAYANVTVEHQWNSAPRIELIKGQYVTFTTQADIFIAKKLKELSPLINTQLASLDLKGTVSKSWKAYSIPLKQLPIEEEVNLSIVPKQAVISDIIYDNDALTMATGLTIQTGLHLGKLSNTQKISPPVLAKIKTNQPQFKLFLPLHIDYKVIEKQINKEINGKSFKQKTDVGDININVTEVFVYPSNKKIVIGVKFNADVNEEHLKTAGKVFLVSKPVLNKTGTSLRLTQVSFTRDFNNALLNAITYVFKTRINSLIETKAHFDLTEPIQQTLALMTTELDKNQKDSKFKIHLHKPKLRLSQIVVGSKQLVLESKLTGFVDVRLNGLPE